MEGWQGCGQGPLWPWDQKPREGADVLGKHVQWASADICVTAAFVALKSVDVSAQCQLSEGRTGVGCTLSSPAPEPPGTAVWLERPFDFTASCLQKWSVTMMSTLSFLPSDTVSHNDVHNKDVSTCIIHYTHCCKPFPHVTLFNAPAALPLVQVWTLRRREAKGSPMLTQGGLPLGF